MVDSHAVVAPPKGDLEAARLATECRALVEAELGKRIIGQKEAVEKLLIALLAGGHSLIVGVPGLAKTSLIATLAELLNLSFARIQFTPDLMPADITGTDILHEDSASGKRFFRFIKGPIFASVILADEINRTPPKTQAALLQAMQELRITVAGSTYSLDRPFWVFATQNPIEQQGTYPLPEAQLDRFMFEIEVDYPTMEEEIEIVRQTTSDYRPTVRKVLGPSEILRLQELVRRVPAAEHVAGYAVRLCRASRPAAETAPPLVREYLAWGAGPRAAQYLLLGAKAKALLDGRYAVRSEDVAALAHPVLRHRLVRNFHAEAEGIRAADIIDRLLEEVRQR